MKKIIFAIIFVVTFGLSVNAQNDDFFRSWSNDSFDNRDEPTFSSIIIPNHFGNNNSDAPLGSGLLVLTAFGAGYAVAKRKRS